MTFRMLPLIGILLLAVIACGVRPLLQWRRTGRFGLILLRSKSRTQNIRDALGILGFGVLIWQAHEAVFRPGLVTPWIEPPALQMTGAAVLFGGLAVLIVAQLDLGNSWRIGIEEGARPGLVTGGLYRFCRHPIFLGLLAILAGYTLMLPTALSLVVLAGGFIAVRQQVAAEEAYLARSYGADYRDYAQRVGRFLPGIGRAS